MEDLYSELLVDHGKNPRNYGPGTDSMSSARLNNPLCGDSVCVSVSLDNGKVSRFKFEGEGCLISQASTSILSELALSKSPSELKDLGEIFRNYITGSHDCEAVDIEATIGDLIALSGVKKFPVRSKCALLGFEALFQAIEKAAKTEEDSLE